MENKISFSEFIKNEILNNDWTKHELYILFYSFLRSNGTFKAGKYIVTTTLVKWETKFNEMFLEYYDLDIKPNRTKTLIKYEIDNKNFIDKFTSTLGKITIGALNENKAYIAGLFIGKGWVNSPSSRFYHFEVRVRHLSHHLDVQEAFDGIRLQTITMKKKQWYYTYIKKSSEISNVLKVMNASQSVMFFEDSRIERDFIATFKKMESIEIYNYKKSLNASKRQIKAIKIIQKNNLFNTLNKNIINLANLRISKPKYSLSELQMEFNNIYDKNISKSSIYIWLKKIIKIAEGEENN